MPTLSHIAIYPIKSMDPQSVDSSALVGDGGLAFDRAWCFFGEDGKWLRAKRCPTLQQVRTHFDLSTGDVIATAPVTAGAGAGQPQTFNLHRQADDLAAWVSGIVGEQVTLKHNADGGFPDEMGNFAGPTVISTATLEAVGQWFGGIPLAEMRRRFRANLEIAGVEPFWEDRLLTAGQHGPRLRIGEVRLHGFAPCGRCAVPTRDSRTGAGDRDFQKTFMARREATLPPWADRNAFRHYFCLAVRCHVEPSTLAGSVRVGDQVELLS